MPRVVFATEHDGYAYVPFGGGPLYVTHDGGARWHAAFGRVGTFAVGGGYAYALNGSGLERSAVVRDAWTRLASPVSTNDASIAVLGSRLWLLGRPRRRPDFATLATSTDRGRTFTRHTGPCLYDLPGRLVPAGGGVVWAVCPTGMMAGVSLSTDGGLSFPALRSFHDPAGTSLPPLTNGAEIFPLSPQVAVLDGGGDGPLLRTTDEGRRWARVRQPARIVQLDWLGFTTHRFGLALVQTRPSPTSVDLWRTTDGGASWRDVPIR